MSYASHTHPLASLSAAVAAAAGPEPAAEQPNSESTPPPVRTHAQTAFGTDANHQAAQQYFNQGTRGSTRGDRVVNSPDSIPSPHQTSTMQPVAPSSGTSRAITAKKRKGSHGKASGAGDPDDDKLKKRQVVSCGECKRRKIKCSRTHPCLACCKRGEPEACRWDAEAAPPKEDTQPFAISSDLLLLADRVQALERWARSLPNELGSTAPQVQGFTPSYYGNKTKKAKTISGGEAHYHYDGQGSSVAGTATREGTESPVRGTSVERGDERRSLPLGGGDTEDAVIKLESVAFDQRMPGSRYRPVDSLPFFDNVPGTRLSSSTNNNSSCRPTDQHQRTRSTVATIPPETDTYAQELTSELTSIVAYPLSFEGPYSGPSLGLPIVGSLEELKEAKQREMEAIYKLLPDRELSDQLVERYFREVDWLMNILFEHIFNAEHERYWEMREAGRGGDIDPMWIACYCMVLALGVDGLRCETPEHPPSFEERRMYRPTWYYASSLRLMQLGDATGRPQIRFIQMVVLIGQWLAFSTTGGHAGRCLSLLSTAMRTAQILGLHQMSSDPSQMPPPDPAWPPHANSVKREGAIRLYGFLTFLDYMAATTRFKSYLLDPLQCTTPPVSNVNLKELSSTDWRITPHARNVYTDGSFEWAKWRVAQASREAFSRLVLQPSTFTYETVTELDSKFRKVIEEVSAALPAEGAISRSQQWKRLVCLEGIHARLIRLHRPFMLKKERSRKCCVESAEFVIKSQLQIQEWTNSIWFVYSHSLAAGTALFADLFDAIDRDLPERQIESKKEILVLAFEIFAKHDEITSPHLRQIVQTGSKILSGLFMAEEKRRVTRAATALVPNASRARGGAGGKPNPPPESFAQVLQRLTLELDIHRSSARLASPSPGTFTSLPNPTTAHYQSSASLLQPPRTTTSGLSAVYSNTDHDRPQGLQRESNYFVPPPPPPPFPVNSPGSFEFNVSSTGDVGTASSSSGSNAPTSTHALPGMVGNEDFWKDGLGLGFGTLSATSSGIDYSSTFGNLGGGGGIAVSGNGFAVGGGGIEYGGGPSSDSIGGGGGGNGFNGPPASVFDFWDLSTPPTNLSAATTTGSYDDSSRQGYLVDENGNLDWNGGVNCGGGGGGGAVGGENRRAAEVMADQLMSTGW